MIRLGTPNGDVAITPEAAADLAGMPHGTDERTVVARLNRRLTLAREDRIDAGIAASFFPELRPAPTPETRTDWLCGGRSA